MCFFFLAWLRVFRNYGQGVIGKNKDHILGSRGPINMKVSPLNKKAMTLFSIFLSLLNRLVKIVFWIFQNLALLRRWSQYWCQDYPMDLFNEKVHHKIWKENHMSRLIMPFLSIGFWIFKYNNDHFFLFKMFVKCYI